MGKAAYGAGTLDDGSFAIKVRDTTVKQIAPKPDVAKEAFGDAVTAVAGANGWNTGDHGEAVVISPRSSAALCWQRSWPSQLPPPTNLRR